jgi:outer membrane protein OmpA-like peptidoglycan-associated protein
MRIAKRFPLNWAAAALLSLSPTLYAEPATAPDASGYVVNHEGVPVRDRSGQCVHTHEWQKGMRFRNCEPAPVVEAPAPVVAHQEAPAETPAPAPVPQNVPFRVSMDAFFAFDKATLSAEGKAALDDLASRLAVTQYDTLTIVGHTDRIGTPQYNQKLSERRANAIAAYLAAHGIDESKIAASGVGESEATAQCTGVRGKRLIDCLQPDRNALLTAVGTELRVSDASQ